MKESGQAVADTLDNSFAGCSHTQKPRWELQSPEGSAGLAARSNQKRSVAEAVQQRQVSAAPSQRNNHLQAAERTDHMLGEVVADTAVEDPGNEEAAGNRKVEGQPEDPTAEDQRAYTHHHAVDCSYLEVPSRCDSAQTSAKPVQ
jgi:hypothetical protein